MTFKLTMTVISHFLNYNAGQKEIPHKGASADSVTIMKYKPQGVNHEIYCALISHWLLRLPIALQLYC